MSGFQELFFGLHKIITPLVRLFEESRSETSHSIELRRFYQKVINEVKRVNSISNRHKGYTLAMHCRLFEKTKFIHKNSALYVLYD